MLDSLTLVLPVFGLIAIGLFAALLRLADDAMADGLSRFLFAFALPALLFKMVSGTTLPDALPWGYWLAYFGGMALMWGLAMVLARRLFRLPHGESVIAGLATGQANTVMIGVPIIIKAYGEAAAFPIALLLAVNLPTTMTIATLLLSGSGERSLKAAMIHNAKALATHPILVGIFAGLLAQLAGYRPSGPVAGIVEMIAAMAVPGALLALGMSLKRHGLVGHMQPALMICVLKLIGHPLIAYLIGRYLFDLPPPWLGAAVLFAASPAGVNVYLFARRSGEGVGLASTVIALSTLLSLVSSALWLMFLKA